MKSQKFKIKILSALLLLSSSVLLSGCGTDRNVTVASSTEEPTGAIKEAVIDVEATVTPVVTPIDFPIITPTTAPTATTAIMPGTVLEDVAKDLDGNGVDDNIQIISLNDDGGKTSMRVYLNGEQIYEYEDPNCRFMGIGAFEYLDLDGDNSNELFITAGTNANSRPYTEVLCLKQTDGRWNQMDLPKNAGGNKEFPFKITRGKNEFDYIISSYDTNQVIHFDASPYLSDIPSTDVDIIQSYLSSHNTEGAEVGFISAWGIWAAKTGTYKGRNCIIAEEGIEGPPMIGLGRINIYFAYDEQGKVDILKVKYLPQ